MGYLKNTETYPTKYKKASLRECNQLKYAYDTVVFRWLHTYELHLAPTVVAVGAYSFLAIYALM